MDVESSHGGARRDAGSSPSATSVDGRVRATLRKQEILRGKKSISAVFNSGVKLTSPPIVCLVRDGGKLPTDTLNRRNSAEVRVAFVVRRSIKRAVERNRIKRLLREAYRRNKQLLTHTGPDALISKDIIFLYSPGSAQPPRKLTYIQIDACMRRILLSLSRLT